MYSTTHPNHYSHAPNSHQPLSRDYPYPPSALVPPPPHSSSSQVIGTPMKSPSALLNPPATKKRGLMEYMPYIVAATAFVAIGVVVINYIREIWYKKTDEDNDSDEDSSRISTPPVTEKKSRSGRKTNIFRTVVDHQATLQPPPPQQNL